MTLEEVDIRHFGDTEKLYIQQQLNDTDVFWLFSNDGKRVGSSNLNLVTRPRPDTCGH